MSTHKSESPAAETTAGDGLEHVSRVNPENQQSEPVVCPDCGSGHEAAKIEAPRVRTVYVCPANPDIRRAKPGDCPDCGSDLEAEEIEAPAARKEFVCPAHPAVHRAEPGNCPDCGSDLQERIVQDMPEANTGDVDAAPLFWIRLVLLAPFFFMAIWLFWKWYGA